MEIYDISKLVEEKNTFMKIGAFTKFIRPNVEFFNIVIARIIKKGNEYKRTNTKSLLCDKEASELLLAYSDMFLSAHVNGKMEMYASQFMNEETLYKLQEELNLSEDEIIVAKKVEEKKYKLEKMKVSELPIKPFPEISEELVEKLKVELAKEELEKTKEEIERKYGVKLG